MMRKQDHLSLVSRNPLSRLHVIGRLPFLAAAMLALCLSPSAASAQFSGPATGIAQPVNPTVTPTTDPAILYPASRDVILEQGDLLTVQLYGMTDYAPVVRVSLDGTVQLPLIGRCIRQSI
jgi:polysaccharide export outer membrane protein